MPSSKRHRRLDQLFSQLGYGSRVDFKRFMYGGRVTVDGKTDFDAGDRVDPALVQVDGKALDNPDGLLILLNKPVDYVCSHNSEEGATVYELLPAQWSQRSPQVVSIGRLDKDTSGLLLLTDQSELVHRLTSPKHHVAKLYEVEFEGTLPANAAETLASGTMMLHGEKKPCLPAKLEVLSPSKARLEIIEGRYHQVRRMFGTLGTPVTRLRRLKFDRFDLSGVKEGEYRLLPLDSFDLS